VKKFLWHECCLRERELKSRGLTKSKRNIAMKKLIYKIPTIVGLILLSSFLVKGNMFAKENETEKPVREQLKYLGVNIPFIDRDGDGINDLLQYGWGLKFLNRYKKRAFLWERLNAEVVVKGKKMMVDTDGDGVEDMPFHKIMKKKMDKLVDTDKDGKPDTLLREYLRKRFQSFDHNGDGLPDELTREEIHQYMKDMDEWHNQVHERIQQGLAPFVDENGDGIPDDVPAWFGRGAGPYGGPHGTGAGP
jgi:hypothetical protein